MARRTVRQFEGKGFGLFHDREERPNITDFRLHSHSDLYEIILYLEGECVYNVDGNLYKTNPHDFIFSKPFELHMVELNPQVCYDRVILYINKNFFRKHNCEKYLKILENRVPGIGNRIMAGMTDGALEECMRRIEKYSKAGEYDIAEHCVVEFLYLMNEVTEHEGDVYTKNERIRNIIIYINEHLTDELNLDLIADKFYISKNHMCSMFKKCTGHTINSFINYKRVLYARELCAKGQSLMQASVNSGFNSYSSFYRAYQKYIGTAPREDKS